MRNAWLSIPLIVMPLASGQTDPVRTGLGSYTTTLPPGGRVPSDSAGNPAYPVRTSDLTGPTPTSSWWTPMVWAWDATNPDARYSETMYAHPLCFLAVAEGIQIQYPRVPSAAHGWVEYHYYPATWDLLVGLEGLHSASTEVAAFGDWSVTGEWSDAERTLRATLGQGMPFVYFTSTGGNAQVSFNEAPYIWHNDDGIVGVTIGSAPYARHYGVFGPTGAVWTQADYTAPLLSNLDAHDYFSVAVLPDVCNESMSREDCDAALLNTLSYFHQYAYAFIVDTTVTWDYNVATAELTTTYTAETTPREGTTFSTLMALYRHQWLNTSAPLTEYTYASPRHTMKLFEGSSFSTSMAFHGVLPSMPNMGTYDTGTLSGYVEDVYQEYSTREICAPPDDNDTYWCGKDLGRASAVVHIAHQIGHIASDYLATQIKTKLENWLTASPEETQNLFYYNDTWGTLIGFPAERAFHTDTELNDHHFHYGYFVMAAATVAQYDRAWALDEAWGAMVKLVIRDAASGDENDPLFPRLRSFDPYAGHSWASGHAVGVGRSDGNNQESSSESMNLATGMILFGAITGDDEVRDLGIFLYVNEAQAIQQYWFDVDQQVFPAEFEHAVLRRVWGNGGEYGLEGLGWEPVEYFHAINFLPITGGSMYLGYRPDYVFRNYGHLLKQNAGPEERFRYVIWNFLATADPASAICRFEGASEYSPERGEGETRAHTYHWIHNYNAMGTVEMSVTADIPTYSVFQANGNRTYVAYNPDASSKLVRFSDGRTLSIPPDALEGCAPPRGDFNCDDNVNLVDYGKLAQCIGGPSVAPGLGCEIADLDGDSDVDLGDFGLFQAALGRLD